MSGMYRLSWETVGMNKLVKYCNANPLMYKNVTQTVPNSQIPDEDWYPVSKETDNPWDQYRQLKEWADNDTEFIRNVKLERRVAAPEWTDVTPDEVQEALEEM